MYKDAAVSPVTGYKYSHFLKPILQLVFNVWLKDTSRSGVHPDIRQVLHQQHAAEFLLCLHHFEGPGELRAFGTRFLSKLNCLVHFFWISLGPSRHKTGGYISSKTDI